MKKTPRSKALDTLQKLVRVKAADENGYCTCVTCGLIDLWSSMDGGHYIAKGHSSYWALVEENVHPQCKGCNGFGMKYGTAASQYTLYMIDTYGREFVEEMEEKKRDQVKYYKKDYEAMTKEWSLQIKEKLKGFS
ncbi:MAG: recombination protein NinG [Methylococcales bacterium]